MRPTNASVICYIIAGWVTGSAARFTSWPLPQPRVPCKYLLNGKLDSTVDQKNCSPPPPPPRPND